MTTLNLKTAKTAALRQRAYQVTPLGVNSNFRYWGEGITPYVSHAKGCHLVDVDGNDFIDKVIEEVRKGVLFAMTGELEIEVEEMMQKMVPNLERIRFACSGTEATMHAIRVARAYTGRELILKFEGNYHGMHDHTMWSTYAPAEAYGNRRSPIVVAASSGMPRSMGQLIITVPFNDADSFERIMAIHGPQIAAVISEPCQGNCGAILPQPGFLELVQSQCKKYGALFILDEVKTGFRLANGGAKEYYKLDPDMTTYAKSLGNGYPVAALGGRKDIFDIIGQGVSQGGTYTNNKPGIAGAWATLKLLQSKPILEDIRERGTRLMAGIDDILTDEGIVHAMNGYPAMFSYTLGVDRVTNQREWDAGDRGLYLALIDEMVKRGVMPDRDAREPWFLCWSHTDEVIDQTLEVFREAVKAVKK